MTIPVGPTQKAKRKHIKWWKISAVFVFALLGLGVLAVPVGRSARDDVPAKSLQSRPEEMSILEKLTWKPFFSTAGADEWAGENGALLHEEVSKHGGPLASYYRYKTTDPADRYTDEYPGLVEKYSMPSGFGADDATIACGNKGNSTTSLLEDCQIWAYWGRYGQYTVYLEVFDWVLDANQFVQIAKAFDDAISAKL
jgi:hypothetical protein